MCTFPQYLEVKDNLHIFMLEESCEHPMNVGTKGVKCQHCWPNCSRIKGNLKPSYSIPHSSDIAYCDTTGRVIFWNVKWSGQDGLEDNWTGSRQAHIRLKKPPWSTWRIVHFTFHPLYNNITWLWSCLCRAFAKQKNFMVLNACAVRTTTTASKAGKVSLYLFRTLCRED